MVMLKTEVSAPRWVPEGYKKLGWHAGFDVLIGPMYFKREENNQYKFITKIWISISMLMVLHMVATLCH